MRKIKFNTGDFYHIYNRGTDKRPIFMDQADLERFFMSMKLFNTINPIESIAAYRSRASMIEPEIPLVNFINYNLNFNHLHFCLEQTEHKGIEKFMHRLGTGYTNYFNTKYKRSGALFQGKFKAKFVDNNEYLLHLSAYINQNDKIHNYRSSASRSSWDEYTGIDKVNFCKKDIILGQFKNVQEYKEFAESSLDDIKHRRNIDNSLNDMLID